MEGLENQFVVNTAEDTAIPDATAETIQEGNTPATQHTLLALYA